MSVHTWRAVFISEGGTLLNKQDIFEIVARHCYEVLPELEGHTLKPEESLQNLGANSIDRVEIVTLTLETLSLHTPRVAFTGVNTLGGLVDVLYEKVQSN